MNRFFLTAATILLAGAGVAKAQLPSYQPTVPTVTVTQPVVSLDKYKSDFLASEQIQKGFPRLGASIQVIAPPSDKYNALGYVLGSTDRWVWPTKGTAASELQEIDQLMGQSGYRRLSTFDATVRPGKQKAVLYATLTPDGDLATILSVALQHADGTYSCKVGANVVIRFSQLEQLRGPTYGVPMLVYERDLLTAVPTAFAR